MPLIYNQPNIVHNTVPNTVQLSFPYSPAVDPVESLIVAPILKEEIFKINHESRRMIRSLVGRDVAEDVLYIWKAPYCINSLVDTALFDDESVGYTQNEHYTIVGDWVLLKVEPAFPLEFAYYQDVNVYNAQINNWTYPVNTTTGTTIGINGIYTGGGNITYGGPLSNQNAPWASGIDVTYTGNPIVQDTTNPIDQVACSATTLGDYKFGSSSSFKNYVNSKTKNKVG